MLCLASTRRGLLILALGALFSLQGFSQVLYAPDLNRDEVRRIDYRTGMDLGIFISGSTGISDPRQVLFGQDGMIYVGSRYTGDVRRFDAATGALLGMIPNVFGQTGFKGMAFGPDGNLYVGSNPSYAPNASSVERFDPQTGAHLGSFVPLGLGGLSSLRSIAFGPDLNLYVATGPLNFVKRYDGFTGAYLGDFIVAGSPVNYEASVIAFGPDGHLYVAGFTTGDIYRYHGATGQYIDTFIASAFSSARDIEFAPDGTVVVSHGGWLHLYQSNGVYTKALAPSSIQFDAVAFRPAHRIDLALPPIQTIGQRMTAAVYGLPNQPYIFDLSATGTTPGLSLGAGLGTVPLNSPLMALSTGLSVFRDFTGVLDATGRATPSVEVPLLPSLVGLELHGAVVGLPIGSVSHSVSPASAVTFQAPPPVVSLVAPRTVPHYAPTYVTVHGSGFHPRATVNLYDRAGLLPFWPVSFLTVHSSQYLTFYTTAIPSYAAPLFMDLWIRNPDGQTFTLPAAIRFQ